MKDLCSSSNQPVNSTTSTPLKTVSSADRMNGSPLVVSSSSSTSPVNQHDEDTVEYMEVEEIAEEGSSNLKYTLKDVPVLLKRPIRKAECWYIIDRKWYDSFLSFLEFDDTTYHPGKIDNSGLIAPISNFQKTEYPVRLKAGKEENVDFVPIPEEAWNILVENFGLVDGLGGKAIRCPVLGHGKDGNYLVLEYRPLELRLSLYGSKEDAVRHYSRACLLRKILEDMKSIFRVRDSAPWQLWAEGTLLVPYSEERSQPSNTVSGSINPVSSNSKIPPPPPPPPSPSTSNGTNSSCASLDQCLGDLQLAPTTTITLEIQNNDGTWPSLRTARQGAITRSRVAAGVQLSTPGICGLLNMGNTCFMNAALQCLSNVGPLTQFFLSDRHMDDINPDNPLGMRGEIARRYADLVKVIWSGCHTSFAPREFRMAVIQFAPQFSGFAHHDCQELMAFLLDGLHEDLNRVKVKPYIEMKNDFETRPDEIVAVESWQNYKRRNDSTIVDIFHAQLKSTLVCPECDLVSVTFDPFCYLTLPLPYKHERAVNIIFIPARSKKPHYNPRIASTNASVTFTLLSNSNESSTTDMDAKPLRSIFMENVMIPKIGCFTEISNAVAKVLNEARNSQTGKPVFDRTFESKKFIVANVSLNGFHKIYSSTETYTSHFDDIVVFEMDDMATSSNYEPACQTRSISKLNGFHLPVFIRHLNTDDLVTTRPFFINVKHYVYDDIREAIFKELATLVPSDEVASFLKALNSDIIQEEKVEVVPKNSHDRRAASAISGGSDGEVSEQDEEEMGQQSNSSLDDEQEVGEEELEDGTDQSNSYSYNTRFRRQLIRHPAYSITSVNHNGSREFAVLQPGGRLDSPHDTYLAVNINSDIIASYFPRDINKHNQIDLATLLSNPNMITSHKSSLTLAECINQFTLTEKLGENDPWFCPRCKKHQMASKKFDIWSLPNNLIIHLKRFSYSRLHRDKLDVMVEFPLENLDMTAYVLHNPNKESFIYDLTGVSNHYGELGGGHYTAYAKNFQNNQWHLFDDASVTGVHEKKVMSKAAYVLFYQRRLNETPNGVESSTSDQASD